MISTWKHEELYDYTSEDRQCQPSDFAIVSSCFASGFSGNMCIVARSQTYSETGYLFAMQTGYQVLSVTFMTWPQTIRRLYLTGLKGKSWNWHSYTRRGPQAGTIPCLQSWAFCSQPSCLHLRPATAPLSSFSGKETETEDTFLQTGSVPNSFSLSLLPSPGPQLCSVSYWGTLALRPISSLVLIYLTYAPNCFLWGMSSLGGEGGGQLSFLGYFLLLLP